MNPVREQQLRGDVAVDIGTGTIRTTSQSSQAQINILANGTKPDNFSREKTDTDKGATTAQNEQLPSTNSSTNTTVQYTKPEVPNLHSGDIEASAGIEELSGRTQEATGNTVNTLDQVLHNLRVNEAERKAGFWRRLGMALFGGLSLVVPMIIMAIHTSLLKSLITSSCFVLAFAVAMAGFTAARDSEMIVGTAAYAAVLVVFVGVSIKP